MNARDVAATLRFGDRVNGLDAYAHPFTGYLCADPGPGKTAAGDDATILRLASHPVPGRGSTWTICRHAVINLLPAAPAVAAELLTHLDVLHLDDEQRKQVEEWCTDQSDPLYGEH